MSNPGHSRPTKAGYRNAELSGVAAGQAGVNHLAGARALPLKDRGKSIDDVEGSRLPPMCGTNAAPRGMGQGC